MSVSDITLGQIATSLAFIVGLIGAIKYILKDLDAMLDKKIKVMADKFSDDMKDLKEVVTKLDEGQCKNFLVRFLKDVENGNPIDAVEEERAYEIYDRYVNVLHKNSYIHDKWERLMKPKEK